jgi:NAD(P)H-quinone oxidoreductase subunit 5
MNEPWSLLVLTAPATLALAAWRERRASTSRREGNASGVAACIGLGVAAAAGVLVATRGLVESPELTVGGLGLSIRLDPLSTIMLGMIALLGAVIVRYSTTYLDGDPRRRMFLARLGLTIAAVEMLVLAGNLGLLVLAWVATSMALHRLLVFYPDRPRAVAAARKKFIVARAGDVLLVGAALLLWRWAGTGNLEQIFERAREGLGAGWALTAPTLAGLLLAITAALKSAQFPTHGWLIEVMETPTPVSALLHAGLLNAGPFLAIRMGWVLDGSHLANVALLVAGGTTALIASVALLTQPSVKVALAYSSAAHMGFMLLVCSMGVYPAALLHLVAHSFYKAHAFLSSGSVVDERRAAKVTTPRRLGRPARIAASLGVAGGIYLALAWLLGVNLADQPVLLLIGAILVMGTTQIVAPALDAAGRPVAVARTVGAATAVTLAFFTLEAGAHHLLGDTAPHSLARTPIHAGLFVAVLAAFGTAVWLQILEPTRPATARRRAAAVHLRNGLYANAVLDRVVGSFRLPKEVTR